MPPRIPLPEPLARSPFTTGAAYAVGLTPNRLRGPDLQRPFRGVRVASQRPLSLEERCLALSKRLPDDAWFSDTTAANLTGVPLPSHFERELTVHVAVPHPRRAPRGANVRGHAYRKPEYRLWHGLQVSSPDQLWMQLATTLSVPDLVAAGDFLVHHRLPHTTIQSLTNSIHMKERGRGLANGHAALPLLSVRSESPRESHLRVLLLTSELPGLEVNKRIAVTGGWRYRGDLVFPAARMIIEYQGDHHRDPKQYRDDLTRISRLEADGWYVMQVTTADLDYPLELVGRIRRKLALLLS